MTHLEVEVKFWVSDLTAVRAAVIAAGGQLVRPRVFEQNVRYDTANNDLQTRGALLRLRADTETRLTFKGLPPQDPATGQGQARVREELEVVVSDFDLMATMLERLGFASRQRYEKYREAFRLGLVEVVLDELPFGDFVELEGPVEALAETAAVLGLDWEQRILLNYLALLDELKARVDLPFADLTFDNFAGRNTTLRGIVSQVHQVGGDRL